MNKLLSLIKLTAQGGLLVLLPILLFILLLMDFVDAIEDLVNGTLTALFPYAPTGFAGPVKIVPQTAVAPMDASLGDVGLV